MPLLYELTPRIRPTRVEIDLSALIDNARLLTALTATAVHAVVKADAYGHGAPDVARALEAAGAVAGFAVSLVEEGVQLRAAGVTGSILVMGPALAGGGRDGHDELVERGMTPVVSDRGDLDALAAIGRRRGAPVAVHLKVDTGMSRLGLARDGLGDVVAAAQGRGVDIVGLMTHFACADNDDPADPDAFTWEQLRRFGAACAVVRTAGAPLIACHAANSSGAMLFADARLDLVRCGLALYGNGHWASDATLSRPRRQAMRLCTAIAQLRTVAAGELVGYGGLWRATAETRVAVLPLGYADGLPRRATGHGEALIRGVRCPLIGAISMDLAIADVSALPACAVGDEVVLLGGDGGGGRAISTAEYAAWTGLTEYEVTCGMSKRVPRVYR